MNIHKRAFTLVELIVVMWVLSILWTIWMFHYLWNSAEARDVVRVNDLKNMSKSIEFYWIKQWRFPTPDEAIDVTYSWSIVWSQWVFGTWTRLAVQNLDKVPLDPLTGDYYSYSVLKNNQEYELGGIIEWGISFTPPWVWDTFANNSVRAYTTWNYNKRFSSIKNAGNTIVIALPSITTSSFITQEISEIIDNGDIVIHKEQNIPENFNKNWEYSVWNTKNIVSEIEIFNGNIWDLATIETQRQFIQKLQNSFSGSTLLGSDRKYISLMNVDTSSDLELTEYVDILLEKWVWWLPKMK